MMKLFYSLLLLFLSVSPLRAMEYINGEPQGGGAAIGSYEDVVGLWTDCGSLFMKGDGTCGVSSIVEVDPAFAAWDRSTGVVITTSQILDIPTYLTYTDITALWTDCVAGVLMADGTCVVLGSAANLDITAFEPAGAAAAVIAAAVTESDTTHCPDGASVFNALAGKQASGSYLTDEVDPTVDSSAEIQAIIGAGVYAPIASPDITGDPTITDATPSLTLRDSDNAAGTASTNANSSGGANDMTWTFGVEDSTGESTGYFRLNGVTERIEPLKPMSLGPLYITGTDDALADEGYAGTVITGTAGAALAVGDIVYLSDTDGRWELADNDSTTAEANQAKGVCVLTAAADGDATNIFIHGKMRLDSWTWNDNEGQPLFLSATAGDLTETRPISASSAPQIVAYIESDDEIFVNPQPIDFSRIRIKTDADGQTLTCLEVQNTMWEVTAAATIVGPALSACPTQNFTICSSVAGAVVYAPNAADDTIVDGTAKADGVAWTSGSALGDCITITQYDTDTLFGVSNGWTAP